MSVIRNTLIAIVSVVVIFSIYDSSSAMQSRYCRGIYNDMVQTISDSIFSGEDIDKKDIVRSVNFLDNRKTSPIIESKYGDLGSVYGILDGVRLINDSCLMRFAENCRTCFCDSKDLSLREAIGFLLYGVVEKCKKLFKLKANVSNEPITFSNAQVFGITFDKPLILMFETSSPK